MLKLNHSERSIIIAALILARHTWNREAGELRTQGKADDALRLSNSAIHARELCVRFEEEHS